MKASILWKLIATGLVLAYAITSLLPIKDTPFAEFILEEVSHEKEAFSEIVAEAKELQENGQARSVYVGVQQIANRDRIDLIEFFPHVTLADIRNQDRRNQILLSYLLEESKSSVKQGLDLKGGVGFTLKVQNEIDTEQDQVKNDYLNKAIDIIRQRINSLGLSEPLIRPKGEGLIEVQLPGLNTEDDPDVINQLKKPAKLEFRKVYPTAGSMAGKAPLGYETLIIEGETRDGQLTQTPAWVKVIPEATGSIVSAARASINESGGYEILIQFTGEGTERFAEMTAELAAEGTPQLPSRLAIVLDGKLYSMPTVRESIRGGSASISGNFSQREAIELSGVLNNPLDAELTVEEMYEVGATLASGARDSSLKACVLGAALVGLFMILYYGVAGVVSVISVAVNILVVLGLLASMDATLTLPGIAALVLTVGMAVDANILIFERIREELNAGKRSESALLGGFEKALSTIIDANVTTLITASILIWLGTGPVKGFGVTLAIGICVSIFCALVVTRFLLDLAVSTGFSKKIIGFNVKGFKDMDFMSKWKPAFLFSWIIVAIGIGSFVINFDKVFGIDFTGGEELTITYENPITPEQISNLADQQDLGEVLAFAQTEFGTEKEFLKVQTELEQGKIVFAAMDEAFSEAGLSLIGSNTIGGSVSSSITTNALISVVVALFGILLYVALRFEMGYGVGAVVATVHDVLMSVGLYVLLGGQFTAPMLAAVLMIVGYSINDTIVVFDRIREELDLNPGAGLKKIINVSISRVLSRSVWTSLTTFCAAFALYIFGAGVINDFALIFMIGIVTGTFSSIFIASPVFYRWHRGDRAHVEANALQPKSYEWQSSTKAAK